MAGKLFEKGSPVRFIVVFLVLFLSFYYFNILFFGITSSGSHYNSFIAQHLDYIGVLRRLLLRATATMLNWLGFSSITSDTEVLVAGHGKLRLIYSCLGLGVISFFSAFVLAYPKKLKDKLMFLIAGIIVIEVLNVFRFVILGIFWSKNTGTQIIDHHTIFNIIIYLIIGISIYFWVRQDLEPSPSNAKN